MGNAIKEILSVGNEGKIIKCEWKRMKFVKYHNPLYGHNHQMGIVVSENYLDGICYFLTSIPKFRGDYISLKENDPCVTILDNISKEELLLTMSKFKFWWFFE